MRVRESVCVCVVWTKGGSAVHPECTESTHWTKKDGKILHLHEGRRCCGHQSVCVRTHISLDRDIDPSSSDEQLCHRRGARRQNSQYRVRKGRVLTHNLHPPLIKRIRVGDCDVDCFPTRILFFFFFFFFFCLDILLQEHLYRKAPDPFRIWSYVACHSPYSSTSPP